MSKGLEAKSITLAVTASIVVLFIALVTYITFFTPESDPPRRSLPVSASYVQSFDSSGYTDIRMNTR